MKFPVLWSGLCCCTVKCSEILAHIEVLYNPRVNKVFTSLTSLHVAWKMQVKLCYLHRIVCSNEHLFLAFIIYNHTQQHLFSVKITLLLASHKMLQLWDITFCYPAIKLVWVLFPFYKVFNYSFTLSLAQNLFNAVHIIVLNYFL